MPVPKVGLLCLSLVSGISVGMRFTKFWEWRDIAAFVMADPRNTRAHVFYSAKFDHYTSNCMGISSGYPQEIWSYWEHSCSLRNTILPHTSYQDKFDHSRLKHMGIWSESQKNLEALGPLFLGLEWVMIP